MRRTGWRYESQRHSMAARGIRTKQDYFAQKQFFAEKDDAAGKTADFLKALVSDDRPETKDFVQERRQAVVDDTFNEVNGELHRAVQEGRITDERAERFVEKYGPFENEAKDYLDGKIDQVQFKEHIDRDLKRHMQVHARTVQLVDF